MTEQNDRQQRAILQRIADQAMLAKGLFLDFSSAALAELDAAVVGRSLVAIHIVD
jgi:hypothetical protein